MTQTDNRADLAKRQAQAIAFLASTTRPVGSPRWDQGGVYAHVKRLMERGLSAHEVAMRALTHAADPKAKTPGVIATPPKHEVAQNGQKYPPRAYSADECPLHPGQWVGACSSCLGPRAVDEDPGDRDRTVPPRQPRGHTPPTEAWKVARQELDLRHALTPSIDHEEDADA